MTLNELPILDSYKYDSKAAYYITLFIDYMIHNSNNKKTLDYILGDIIINYGLYDIVKFHDIVKEHLSTYWLYSNMTECYEYYQGKRHTEIYDIMIRNYKIKNYT